MDENQDDLTNVDSNDVVNGGVGPGDAEEQGVPDSEGHKDDPHGIKKRLGMQAKKHQREMRAMQEQLQYVHSMLGQNQPQQQDHYSSPGQPNPPAMSEDERIQTAVRYALGMKDQEERKAKDAEKHAHIQKQYQRLSNEFDKASDKYEDFEDVVRGDDVPFTPHVRDAMLLIDNAADVAYRLGKNRDELERISRLHPLDQAREVNKLSFALMNGNAGKPQNAIQKTNPMGNVKPNPAYNSNAVTDKTPPSEIRARMKSGTWK
jgi:predicted Zn-dependent protease